jgi:hypothetical protein
MNIREKEYRSAWFVAYRQDCRNRHRHPLDNPKRDTQNQLRDTA